MRYIPTNLLAVAYVLSVAIVTAAVTFMPGTGAGTVLASSSWSVMTTDQEDSGQVTWNRTYDTLRSCEAAIKGVNERLLAIHRLNVRPQDAALLPDAPDADPNILAAVNRGTADYLMSVGRLPDWRIECKADPA